MHLIIFIFFHFFRFFSFSIFSFFHFSSFFSFLNVFRFCSFFIFHFFSFLHFSAVFFIFLHVSLFFFFFLHFFHCSFSFSFSFLDCPKSDLFCASIASRFLFNLFFKKSLFAAVSGRYLFGPSFSFLSLVYIQVFRLIGGVFPSKNVCKLPF